MTVSLTAGGTGAAALEAALGPGRVEDHLSGPAAALLPHGELRRGEVYSVRGSRSLQLALTAEVSARGGWCALVGFPEIGAEAVHALGVELQRCIVVPEPGEQWLAVTAVLLDAVSMVLLRPPQGRRAELSPGQSARLGARMRHRGSILLVDGPWSGAHASLTVSAQEWEGISQGREPLRAARLLVRAEGRGGGSRPRHHHVRIGVDTAAATGAAPITVSALGPQQPQAVPADLRGEVSPSPLRPPPSRLRVG